MRARRKSIVIGIPSFGTVSLRWAMAYGQIVTPMNSICPRVAEVGYPVDVARNRIVSRALEMDSDPTHILFIDDDVIVSGHCLLQLLKADKDIVAGVYYTKSVYAEPLMFAPPGEGTLDYVPGSGLHRVWGHGMGLTLIRTEVFRRLRDEIDLGVDSQGNPRWYHTSGDEPDDEQCTEDLWFCRNAQAIGYERWVDTSPHAFGWHFDAKHNQGYPISQWDEYLKTGAATFEVPDFAEVD